MRKELGQMWEVKEDRRRKERGEEYLEEMEALGKKRQKRNEESGSDEGKFIQEREVRRRKEGRRREEEGRDCRRSAGKEVEME